MASSAKMDGTVYDRPLLRGLADLTLLIELNLHQLNLKDAKAHHCCFRRPCWSTSNHVIVRLIFIPRNESFKRIFLLLIAPE